MITHLMLTAIMSISAIAALTLAILSLLVGHLRVVGAIVVYSACASAMILVVCVLIRHYPG